MTRNTRTTQLGIVKSVTGDFEIRILKWGDLMVMSTCRYRRRTRNVTFRKIFITFYAEYHPKRPRITKATLTAQKQHHITKIYSFPLTRSLSPSNQASFTASQHFQARADLFIYLFIRICRSSYSATRPF